MYSEFALFEERERELATRELASYSMQAILL